MKKTLAFLTALLMTAATFSAGTASAEMREPEFPVCIDHVQPMYHQFNYNSPDELAAELKNGFPEDILSCMADQYSGEVCGRFELFLENCSRSGLPVPMYEGRGICRNTALFTKDLYGYPAVYYTISSDIFSHMIVQYPQEVDAPITTIDSLLAELYGASGYSGLDKLTKANICINGAPTDVMIKRNEGDPRAYVTFLAGTALVTAVMNNDDLSVLTDLSFDFRGCSEISCISGDADNDGRVAMADAILFQRWLMGAGELANPQVMDLYPDGKLNAYDFVLLKKIILCDMDATGNGEVRFKKNISADGLEKLNEMRRSLDFSDDEFAEYLKNLNSTANCRDDIREFVELADSLTIPILDGAEITGIRQTVTDTEAATVTMKGGDIQLLEISYIPSKTADMLLKNADENVRKINCSVGSSGSRIKVIAESRTAISGGKTKYTWYIDMDGTAVRAICYLTGDQLLDTESLMKKLELTTIGEILSDPTSGCDPVEDSVIDVKSIAELRKCREDLELDDKGFRRIYGDISRTEFQENLDLLESLAVPVSDDGEVTWICRKTGISEDSGERFDIAFVTIKFPEKWLRLEYILSEKFPEQAINNAMKNDGTIVPAEGYIGDPEKNIKYYGEQRSEHDGTTSITWHIKCNDMYVRAVYSVKSADLADTDALMEQVKTTTLGELSAKI